MSGGIESFGDRRRNNASEAAAEAVEEPGTAVLRMEPLPVLIVPTIDETALEAVRARIYQVLYDAGRSALEQAIADVASGQPPAGPPLPRDEADAPDAPPPVAP